MRIPTIRGVIERRVLANYRIDPAVLQKTLPRPFRPKLAHGWGVAGICLIRLRDIRPRLVPRAFGISSENAAHRVAVEWDTPEGTRSGVFIPRRDTSSLLNTLAGGRVFPGSHHRAEFEVRESETQLSISVRSRDGSCRMRIEAEFAAELPGRSIFGSLEEASDFFEAGSLGYSVTPRPGEFDGLELRSLNWRVYPLQVSRVQSSFFSDARSFPDGSVEFDSALLMRGVDHEWHSRESLCCDVAAA